MKIKVVSRKMIKPSIPTPPHLQNYSISFLDELIQPMNISFLLFYPSKPDPITRLEESLSQILVRFYPLAGRFLKQHSLVDCSDQGAEFVQAEAYDVEVKDLVGKIEIGRLYDLVPSQYLQIDEAAATPLLSIQATEFNCGGSVMCISFSHRVVDVSSARAFIAAWSNATKPYPGKAPVVPTWDFPSLLPCRNNQGSGADCPEPLSDNKIVINSFLFSKEAIGRLRAKFSSPKNGKVSRARLVTALIAKALIRLDCAEYAKPRDCFISQPVDMRWRTMPPLSNHSCGNFSLATLTRCIGAHETEGIGIQELVGILGDAVQRSIAEYARILSPDGKGYEIVTTSLEKQRREWMSSEVNFVSFSDLSKFNFYGSGDLGWGKPIWTLYGPMRWEKTIMLMSNREGDGIEVRVHLEDNHMHRFQGDLDIKSFATQCT